MKKLICILLAAILVFGMSGCRSSKNVGSGAESTSEVTGIENDTTGNERDKGAETTEKDNNNVIAVEDNTQQNTTSAGDENAVNSSLNNTIISSSHSDTSNNHIHNFSQASCTEPKKCACGATEGKALGHSWCEATCSSPQTCSVCKITQGTVGTHIIENGVCKFCKQAIVISPENLDISKTYVHFSEEHSFVREEKYYENAFTVDNIGFKFKEDFCGCIGNLGIYSLNNYKPDLIDSMIEYNGKNYYAIGIGGVGIQTTYEIKDNDIIIRDFYEPTSYGILNLLSDGTIKVIYKTDDFYGDWRTQVGWVYSPINYTIN